MDQLGKIGRRIEDREFYTQKGLYFLVSRKIAEALIAAFVLALSPVMTASAQAQTPGRVLLPASFSVTGVAADDVLNIRAEPSARAPIVGEFSPYRINIEVLALSSNGRWGLVGIPEGNGWVSMRYLELQEAAPGELPRPFICGGLEPDWNLGLYPRGLSFQPPGGSDMALDIVSEEVFETGYRAKFLAGMRYGNSRPALEMRITRARCSDTMSDRLYGWQVLLNRSNGETLQGCCTLDGG